MKKIVAFLLVCLMAVSLCACAEKVDPAKHEKALDFDTMAEVYALGTASSSQLGPKYLVQIFTYEGKPMRAIAAVNADTHEKYDALNFEDEDYDKQREAIFSPLKIEWIDDLSKDMPTQEELDAFVGKKGSDMLAAGFEVTGFSGSDEGIIFFLEKGIYEILAECVETLDFSAEEFTASDAFPNVTIKSLEPSGEISFSALNLD